MRLLLDIQGCQSESRLRGIGRYALSLAKAIARNAGRHEVWLLLNELFPDTVMPLRREFAGLVPPERIAVFSASGPVADREPANSARAGIAEMLREHAIAELNPDVVHIGSLFEGFVDDAVTSVGRLYPDTPTAVTLYDLIPLLNANRYLDHHVYKDYYLRKIEYLKRAHLLLAISASSGREAISALDIAKDRVVDISSAAEERFRPASLRRDVVSEIGRRFRLLRPFILYVGVVEPRKNFEGLIRAYARLTEELRSTHQLLLVAQGDETCRDGLRDLASSLRLRSKSVVIVDRVSDEELVALYRLCRLFVFPSLHEGFGLPALEAMACGAAVIGSGTTSIPEVIGRDDALFDPASPDAIARAMHRALSDEAFHQSLREHGLRQARKFSWDASAKRAIDAFERLHEDRRRGAGAGKPTAAYRRLISASVDGAANLSGQDLLRTAEAIAQNLAPECPRQLLIDVSELAERDARTGIQRATRAIVKQLLEDPPHGYRAEPVRFDRAGVRYRYARAFANTLTGRTTSRAADEWLEVRRGDLFLGLDLSAEQVPQAKPWFDELRRRGAVVAFVVYDLLILRHPQWWPPPMHQVMESWFKTIASASDVLVGISTAVAVELEQWLGGQGLPQGERPRLGYFHLGAGLGIGARNRDLAADAMQVLSRLASLPTFLMVGTLEPRKGHRQVLGAFERLWRDGADVALVIVGKHGWLIDELAERLRRHTEFGQRLFWLEGISDEYLEKLYAASTCLIAASEGEGFGLPLIEAAQHRLPIIARDIAVFREVAGQHAYYFSGMSPEALADAVRNWMGLRSAGNAPSSEGMRWLTWAESTGQLLQVVLGTNTDRSGVVAQETGAAAT